MTTCVIKLMSFLSSTVPPAFTLPMLSTFDEHVESTFIHLLAPSGFDCSRDRMDRAKLKASLPVPFGCGLFKASDQGSIAWWTSVASCLTDPLLFRLRSGLVHLRHLHGPLLFLLLVDLRRSFGLKPSNFSTCPFQDQT